MLLLLSRNARVQYATMKPQVYQTAVGETEKATRVTWFYFTEYFNLAALSDWIENIVTVLIGLRDTCDCMYLVNNKTSSLPPACGLQEDETYER